MEMFEILVIDASDPKILATWSEHFDSEPEMRIAHQVMAAEFEEIHAQYTMLMVIDPHFENSNPFQTFLEVPRD